MRQLQVLLVFLALISLAACGGSKKAVTISINPTTASVFTTQNQQFTAVVTNGSSTAVTWQVNGVSFGDPTTVGQISSAGLYTAPATVPNPATVTITAIPQADTTKSATATVTIQLGANLAISPSSMNINAGAQQTFSVTSNGGAAPAGTTFSLSCKSTVPGACGTITTDGVYTAPLAPPPSGGNVIITASFTQGTGTFSTSATVTIIGSSQSTAGQYAFTLSGRNSGAGYSAAGTLTLDGNGHVTGGAEDINSGGSVSSVTFSSGSYTYSTSDGRLAVNAQTASNQTYTFYLSLANRARGFIEYAASGISASGTVALQNPSEFALSALNGGYAFRLAGFDTSAKQVAEAGAFSANGSGGLTSGLLDANTGGTLSSNQSLTGSVTTADATTGRGTMTITSGFGTQTFAYYMVDGTTVMMVETDGARSTSGNAVQQANSPYATSDIHGGLVLIMNGTSSTGTLGIGGNVSLGSGNASGGSIARNDAGTFTAAQTVTAGTYSVTDAATGRMTASLTVNGTTMSLVLYPQSDSVFDIIDANASESAGGTAIISTGSAGSNSAIQGNYSLNLTGVTGTTPEDVVGTLAANGGGAFTGTVDISNGGANTALQSSPYSISVTSTATLKSGVVNFGSIGFNLYVVDSTQVFFLENDNKGVLTGVMQLQN